MSRPAFREEQETPTKPRRENPKGDTIISGILSLQGHSYFSESTISKARQGSKFRVSPAADAKRQEVLQKSFKAFDDPGTGNATHCCMTLTSTDDKRIFAPPPAVWDHPRPNFRNVPIEIEEKRRKAREAIDLEEDPYHTTRMERKQIVNIHISGSAGKSRFHVMTMER